MTPSADAVRRSIEAVWRLESARLIGGLLRWSRSLDQAEDLAQQAMLEALQAWPRTGIPDNPGAWLMATARRRGIDYLRRSERLQRQDETFEQPDENWVEFDPVADFDLHAGDDRLRLILIACHPILAPQSRAALTLRLLGGLSTDEIARAFLTQESTIAQRIVRAKRSLAEARVPFELPIGEELHARLDSVLEVLYLIFNEGYAATRGSDLLRPELCQDALRLCRALAQLLPDEAEIQGLLALMELQASRFRTRVDAAGAPVLLLDQDRARWDHLQIQRGLNALARAEALAAPSGPYTLQAAIAATHARARHGEDTDWARIVALYDALVQLVPSPVIELNRAVAVSMASGPAAALELLGGLDDDLSEYHLLPAVRGDLLARLGQRDAARQQFLRAASLASNERERELLLQRALRPTQARVRSSA